jgi:predicted dehydrogenase
MINAAIIGLGRWGQAIVAAADGSGRLRFVRGVSKETDQISGFAAAHGMVLSTEFGDALTDPDVQAVVLATPHSLHVDQIVAAAAAGRPVWCEKPLALTRSEAERAIAACRAAGVVFGLGNNKRCFPSMRGLKRIVADGVLGEVLHIEGHFCNEHSTRVAGGWRDDPHEAPGGGMTGPGLHVLDAFVHLGGPIAAVDARLFTAKPAPDPRDSAAVLVEFVSGATGLLATVRAAPMLWRIHVFGTKGWAEVRGETGLTVALTGGTPQAHTYPPADSLAQLLDAFAASVETGRPFPVPVADMLEVVSAFEAIVRSMAAGQRVPVART